MAEYTPGSDEDHIIKTIENISELDLTVFITSYLKIKSGLQSLPKAKSTPDQDTLDYWNNVVVGDEAERAKSILNNQARALYEVLQPIYNAGLIPSKYDDEYTQLENYINSL